MVLLCEKPIEMLLGPCIFVLTLRRPTSSRMGQIVGKNFDVLSAAHMARAPEEWGAPQRSSVPERQFGSRKTI